MSHCRIVAVVAESQGRKNRIQISYPETSHPESAGRRIRELVVNNDYQKFGISDIPMVLMRSLILNWQGIK